DLLYGGPAWSKGFEERFNAYLDVQQTNILSNIQHWSTPLKHNGEGWVPSGDPMDRSFGGKSWQNHNGCNTLGIAAIAYYKGDKELAQYALDCRDHIYTLKNLID